LQLGLELVPWLAIDRHDDVLALQAGLPAIAIVLAEAVDCGAWAFSKAREGLAEAAELEEDGVGPQDGGDEDGHGHDQSRMGEEAVDEGFHFVVSSSLYVADTVTDG
jgi:hypothetical protein